MEEVDLNFVDYQYLSDVKANKECQQKLLNTKPICMVKVISLAIIIFYDSNSLLYSKYSLNIRKKFSLKTRIWKAIVVKKRIGQI